MMNTNAILTLKELEVITLLRSPKSLSWEEIGNGSILLTIKDGYVIDIRLEEIVKTKHLKNRIHIG